MSGKPFEVENQRDLVNFIKRVRKEVPDNTIWMYSGYLFDSEIHNPNGNVHCEVSDEILENIDILVNGKFVEELENLSLKFRGSSNQRIIIVKESLQEGKVILSPLNEYKEFKPMWRKAFFIKVFLFKHEKKDRFSYDLIIFKY